MEVVLVPGVSRRRKIRWSLQGVERSACFLVTSKELQNGAVPSFLVRGSFLILLELAYRGESQGQLKGRELCVLCHDTHTLMYLMHT